MSTARVGLRAPDFDLPCALPGATPGSGVHRARLADHAGRWLALVFYPRDFSMVCPTELTGASARIEDFRAMSCDLLGISIDGVDVHAQWMSTPQHEGGVAGLAFPLATDADGAVARSYGVFDEERGVALRGLFIIDPLGRVQYQTVLPLAVGRGTDETLRVLAALRNGGLCPLDWRRPGQELDIESMLHPGRVIGRYKIEVPLGAGGYAHVFRARDLALDRTVALKVFRPRSRGTISLMLSEARLAASIAHPNLCTIYDIDDGEGVPLLAMECLEGATLSQRIGDGSLTRREAARVLAGLAEGLAAAHERQVVHGDLKPGNIMVLPGGAAKILDFGLARRANPADLDRTRPGPVSGTPRYMAPERFRGHPTTGASDVFAFGVIAYEALTLRPAFGGVSVPEVMQAVLQTNPSRLAGEVERPWSDILLRALVKDPAARTISMREIAHLLRAV